MRTSVLAVIVGVMALLMAGLVVLLTTSRSEAPDHSRPPSAIDTAAASEAAATSEGGSGSRPAAPRLASPIKPMPFVETESDQPSPRTPDPIVVAGEVLDWDGTPATTVGVSLLRLEEGAPVGEAIARADSDGQGRFRLAVPRPAPPECVLVAFKPARRPATLPVALDGTTSTNDLRLTFGMGSTIEGSISLDGRPVSGARVSAAVKHGGGGSLPLSWNGMAFETQRAAAYSDEQGRFLLTGLAPETYWIETDQLAPESSLGLVCHAEVRAPAAGVQLGVQSGRIRIRVLGKGEPLVQARVAIIDPGGARMSIPEIADLRVASGLPFKVEAAQRGFVPRQVAVSALTAGETRDLDVSLDSDDGPDLHLKLRGASEMNLASVSVQFIPVSLPSEEGVCVLKELRRGLRAERGQEDQFLLEDIPYPAGTYMLVLLPEPPESWLRPIQTEIVLPERGLVELTLDVARGGRVDLWIIGASSSALEGHWVLRDAAGAEVLSSEARTRGRPSGHDGRAEAAWLTRSTRVIGPGTYEIEAKSEGYRTVRQEVIVAAGSATTKVIQLEPENQ